MAIFRPRSSPTMLYLRLLLVLSVLKCQVIVGMMVKPVKKAIRTRDSSLSAISSQQLAVLDGGEWFSVQKCLKAERITNFGCMNVIAGTHDGDRVVGMQSPEKTDIEIDTNTYLYPDSVAKIPAQVSDAQAISTLIHSVTLHCVLPVVSQVGGSNDSQVSGKVVVLGGGPYAIQSAQALNSLGAEVTLVTTQNAKVDEGIQVLKPATGELELRFCQVVGQFDSLLDTLGDEQDPRVESGTIRMLRQNHDCPTYVSSQTNSQAIIESQGVLFGPGKADKHIKSLQEKVVNLKRSGSSAGWFAPPIGFGQTVEQLLQNRVAFPALKKDSVVCRSWALADFLEATTWPRDSSSASNIRYGLPVLEDLDLKADEEEMISAPPLRSVPEELPFDDEPVPATDEPNPHVLQIEGVSELQRHVVDAKLDCLLFLSAPFCRTCRYLKPQYQRMARTDESDVVFCKAEAVGKAGKELGRALGIDAVPAFLLFKGGKRYGDPITVTRLPNPKLQMAVKYLEQGKAWDKEKFRDDESDKRKGSKLR